MEESPEPGNGPSQRPRRRSPLLVALAVLVPIVPIVVALVLVSSGGGGRTGRPVASVQHASSGAPTAGTPVSTTTRALTQSKPKPKPKVPTSLIATLQHPTVLRAAPSADSTVIAPQPLKTQFGSPVVMLVRHHHGSWLGVVSPLVGNNKVGWIPRSAVTLSRSKMRITVSLEKRRLEVLNGRHVEQHYRIAIGAADSPTPTGVYAVTDRLQTNDPSGPYGCCILALSAVAPHEIQDWSGGDRIAVHSTPDTSTIGDAVSHGCMHVTLAEGEWLLSHVPLGTPITIRTD